MNSDDRNKIDLVQLGKMYGQVQSIDEKMDTFMEQTGEFHKDMKIDIALHKKENKDEFSKHDKRINWNKNKIIYYTGALAGFVVALKYLL